MIRRLSGFIAAIVILLGTGANMYAAPLPLAAAVPGGIVIVDLGLAHDNHAPQVTFNRQRVMVLKNAGHWQGIVGIPLATKPGQQQLHISGQKTPVVFTVEAKAYAEQRLIIKDKRKVNPTKEDLQRIGRERTRINKALAHWSDLGSVDTRFSLPVTGRMSSPFGLRRFFNDQPRKPHSGIDIAAPEGTPIQAPAAGRIIEAGDFFFNGNSVFIDHGQGLVTMYCHMSKIEVKPGQTVQKGETIGAVGQTGRVTGPHLHWSVSLNDARVDPGLFFNDITALLGPETDH